MAAPSGLKDMLYPVHTLLFLKIVEVVYRKERYDAIAPHPVFEKLVCSVPKVYFSFPLLHFLLLVLTRHIVYMVTELTEESSRHNKNKMNAWHLGGCKTWTILARYLSKTAHGSYVGEVYNNILHYFL